LVEKGSDDVKGITNASLGDYRRGCDGTLRPWRLEVDDNNNQPQMVANPIKAHTGGQ
jgi:hypothetical protein